MNDFLQFVDRVPTLPNRKKITHSDSSVEYATIEYADEPITTGTALNKKNLSQVNRVLGYDKIVGNYNPTTETVEYHHQYVDENNLVDNMRVLVQGANQPSAPADDWVVIKDDTSIGNYFYDPQIMKLNNGNILIAGNNQSNSWALYIAIIDQLGNIVKSPTYLNGTQYNGLKLLKLNNNNIMLLGGTDSNGTYCCIIDQSGNIIKSSTQIMSGGRPQYAVMNNGNIFIASSGASSAYWGYIAIIDQSGNIIKSSTQTQTNWAYLSVVQSDNGQIFIFMHPGSSNQGLYMYKYDTNGNMIGSRIDLTNNNRYNNVESYKLSNGDILVYGNTNSTAYVVIDKNGNILKDIDLSDSIQRHANSLCVIDDHTIAIVSASNNSLGRVTLLDTDTYTITLTKTLAGAYYSSKLGIIKMSNGNLMIVSNDYTSISTGARASAYLVILDNELNIVKEQTKVIDSLAYNPSLIELNNNYILVVGAQHTTRSGQESYEAHIFICNPISTNASASLNGIEIDTIFLKDKFYELVYNEAQNKFIAEEVRNAN